MARGARPVEGSAPGVPERAHTVLQGHGSASRVGGGRQRLSWSRPAWCDLVAYRVAVDEADARATAAEPCGTGVPGGTSGRQGAQATRPPVVTQRVTARLCTAPPIRAGVGQRKRATAQEGRRPQTRRVFGLA